jgi:hypothetical protein
MADDAADSKASNNATGGATTPSTAAARVRRVALTVLFSAILVIARLRRLRRQPRSWLWFRILTGLAGAALIWRFVRGGGGAASLITGLALVAVAVLSRAHSETRSVDDVARELDALVVLNGGAFSAAEAAHPDVRIFVHPERLLVLTRTFDRIAEIPFAALRDVSTIPAGSNGRRSANVWELRIEWESDTRQSGRFLYHGAFAEHLARVAGRTITSVWKKNLPVLPA